MPVTGERGEDVLGVAEVTRIGSTVPRCLGDGEAMTAVEPEPVDSFAAISTTPGLGQGVIDGEAIYQEAGVPIP